MIAWGSITSTPGQGQALSVPNILFACFSWPKSTNNLVFVVLLTVNSKRPSVIQLFLHPRKKSQIQQQPSLSLEPTSSLRQGSQPQIQPNQYIPVWTSESQFFYQAGPSEEFGSSDLVASTFTHWVISQTHTSLTSISRKGWRGSSMVKITNCSSRGPSSIFRFPVSTWWL